MQIPNIYLDHNATSPLLPEVEHAMSEVTKQTFANPSSPHWAGRDARFLLEESRESLAKTLGAKPQEILFTSGGSESNNTAIRQLLGTSGQQHLITSAAEHPSVLETCRILAEQANIALLPIQGPAIDKLQKKFPFFMTATLERGTYRNVDATNTLSVGAQWLVSTRLSSEKVFEMTRALWHPSTRQVLDSGHPVGQKIQLKTALSGLTIPLHDGAKLYYQGIGALPGK